MLPQVFQGLSILHQKISNAALLITNRKSADNTPWSAEPPSERTAYRSKICNWHPNNVALLQYLQFVSKKWLGPMKMRIISQKTE